MNIKDDIYLDRIPEYYDSYNGTPHTHGNTSKGINGKNKSLKARSKRDNLQSKSSLEKIENHYQNYKVNIKNNIQKSQQGGKLKHIFSRIKVWCSGICVNRRGLYDDASSDDNEYKDKMQNAPLLLHDHGSTPYKYTDQSFVSADEGLSTPKPDDIWTVESKYIKEKKPKNTPSKVVTRQYRQRSPAITALIDPSLSLLSNDNYAFFPDKYTEL